MIGRWGSFATIFALHREGFRFEESEWIGWIRDAILFPLPLDCAMIVVRGKNSTCPRSFERGDRLSAKGRT